MQVDRLRDVTSFFKHVLPNVEREEIRDTLTEKGANCILLVRAAKDVVLQRKARWFEPTPLPAARPALALVTPLPLKLSCSHPLTFPSSTVTQNRPVRPAFFSAAMGAKNALLPSAVSWYSPSSGGTPPPGLVSGRHGGGAADGRAVAVRGKDDGSSSSDGDGEWGPHASDEEDDDSGEEKEEEEEDGGNTVWSEVTDASEESAEDEEDEEDNPHSDDEADAGQDALEDGFLKAMSYTITAADIAEVRALVPCFQRISCSKKFPSACCAYSLLRPRSPTETG